MENNMSLKKSPSQAQGRVKPNGNLKPGQRKLSERWLWLTVVIIFTFVSLYPIWAFRFPPMQDYPQHIVQTEILHSFNDPALDYRDNFEGNLKLAPYMTFYALTGLFRTVVPIESAGKLFITLYVLMCSLLVIRLELRSKTDYAPWGLLLFFPFMFNQLYFQGNMNYFFSLPLLIFALLDHEDISRRPLGLWPVCRHLLWQLAIFFTHPFTFLIYTGLTGAGTLLSLKKRAEFIRSLLPPVIAVILFSAWFIAGHSSGSSGQMAWMPLSLGLVWYNYIFTGMLWYDGSATPLALIWLAIGALVAHALLAAIRKKEIKTTRYLLFFALTTVSVFAMPVYKDPYYFLSARIALASYFLLAVIIGQLRFKGMFKGALILLVMIALVMSIVKQGRISTETEDILPVIDRIPSNSRILPLVYYNDSPELDNRLFAPHLHDHNYYHLIKGGGLSPYFPKNTLLPVHYRSGVNRPAPGEFSPFYFKKKLHASDYQYILIRVSGDVAIDYPPKVLGLAGKMKFMVRSGKWTLYRIVSSEAAG